MEFEKIVEAFEDAGYKVRRYSGRGMFGKECLGVSMNGNVMSVIPCVIKEFCESTSNISEVYELVEELESAQTDSMGKGSVIYWPNIEWSENTDESEDFDDEDEEENGGEG